MILQTSWGWESLTHRANEERKGCIGTKPRRTLNFINQEHEKGHSTGAKHQDKWNIEQGSENSIICKEIAKFCFCVVVCLFVCLCLFVCFWLCWRLVTLMNSAVGAWEQSQYVNEWRCLCANKTLFTRAAVGPHLAMDSSLPASDEGHHRIILVVSKSDYNCVLVRWA